MFRHVNIFVIELNWYSQPMHLNQFRERTSQAAAAAAAVVVCVLNAMCTWIQNKRTKQPKLDIFCALSSSTFHPNEWLYCSLCNLPFSTKTFSIVFIPKKYLHFSALLALGITEPFSGPPKTGISVRRHCTDDVLWLNNFQIRCLLAWFAFISSCSILSEHKKAVSHIQWPNHFRNRIEQIWKLAANAKRRIYFPFDMIILLPKA